jgi:TonB family protein
MYAARSAQNESATEAYFALAGQALNGAREHIERYRTFGINVADKDLPGDALGDLDRLRTLLERIANQARELSAEASGASAAAALLEDVSSLRASLARSNQERQQWQHEMASARQRLSAEEARMTPVSATMNTTARNAPARTDNQSIARKETQNSSADTSMLRTVKVPVETNPPTAASGAQPQQPAPAAGAASGESAKTQDGKPVNVGSLIEKATQKINPSYPQNAKTARITGVVTVYVEVDQAGGVSNVQTTSGPLLLRQAAADAARRWKFRPTVVGGQPVRVAGYINFNFTL